MKNKVKVDDRRQMQLELEAARIRYADLYDFAPAGHLTLNQDGEILEANLNAGKLLGLERAGLVGQKFSRFVTAETQGKFHLLCREVFSSTSPQRAELELVNSLDKRFFVHVEAVHNAANHEKKCRFSLIDITERKQLDKRVTRLNRVQAIQIGINHAIVHISDQKKFLDEICRVAVQKGGFKLAWIGMVEPDGSVQPVAQAGVTGYLDGIRVAVTRDKPEGHGPIGTAIRENRPIVVRDIDHDARMIPWMDRTQKFGLHYAAVFPIRVADKVSGSIQFYAPHADFFDENEVGLLTRVSEDISFALTAIANASARKQAEEQLQKLSRAVEQSPVSIIITDASGNIEYVNPKFTALTGYTADEVYGKNPRLLKSGETPPEEYQRLWQAITQGIEWRGEFHNRKKDGELFWETASISPIKNAAGKITHFIAVKEDITQHRLAKQMLLESEKRFHLLANATYEGICITENGVICDVNDQLLKMFGYERDEMVGKDIINFVAPDSRTAVTEGVNHNKEKIYEYQTRHKDGSFFYVETQAKMMRVGSRELRVTAVRDITARKRAEEKLRQSQQRYMLAERATNDGLWDWNLLTDEEYFSPRWKEIIGYREDELPNHKSSFLDNIHPDDRAAVDAITREHLEKGERFALEFRLRHKDGSYRWVFSRGEAQHDPAGRAVRMVGSITDITERKLAEESVRENEARFQQLANSITDVFWITSPDLQKIHFVSQSYEQIWGRTTESLYANPHGWFEAILPEDQERALAIFTSLMGGESAIGIEYRIVRPDGSIRWVLDRGFQVRDATGKVIRLTGVASDITERRQLEEEISTERERLEREVLRRIELEQENIGRDLHDSLCQILVGAKYRIGVLEKMLSEKNVSSAAVEARAIEQILNKLIQQARDLAKGLNPVTLEAKGLAFSLEELAKDIENTGIVHCRSQLSPTVSISDGVVVKHLYRITQEAVQNAIKHGKAQNISIKLHEQAGNLVLTVEDDGAGFPSSPEKSVGAGLYNMRMRAAMIGGTLMVQPGKGGGTLISVNLSSRPSRAGGEQR
ncbi:MAG TPA: PAS domain S-box protein [Candidatus Acidoferrales bacterium]|nr:PAS domain S-box protein [Candidatus Acidoferrales bacterium]